MKTVERAGCVITSAKPFVWTATADEILAKVRLVETNTTVNNNAK